MCVPEQIIFSKLTSNHSNPTENFLNSLKFRDNAFNLTNFLSVLNDNNVSYEIISGFKHDSEDEMENTFKKCTIKLEDAGIIENYYSDEYGLDVGIIDDKTIEISVK